MATYATTKATGGITNPYVGDFEVTGNFTADGNIFTQSGTLQATGTDPLILIGPEQTVGNHGAVVVQSATTITDAGHYLAEVKNGGTTKLYVDKDGGVNSSGVGAFTGAVSGSNLSGTNTGDITLAAVGSAPSANGATLSGQVLTLQPADATHPGVLSAADWNTFNGKQSTVSFAAIGSSANANGASISGGTITLQPASASFGGVLTNGTQTIAGNKTWSDFNTFQSTATFNGGLTTGSSTALTIGSSGTLRFSSASNNITETSGRYVMTASGTDNATAAFVFNTSNTYSAGNPVYRFQNNGTDLLKLQSGSVTWNAQDFNNAGNFNGTGLGPATSAVSPFIRSGSTAANGPNSDTQQTLSASYLFAFKNNGTIKNQINFDGSMAVGSATGPMLIAGSGSPESAVTAPVGSIYMRTNGGAATSIYVKESGAGNTGWVGK